MQKVYKRNGAPILKRSVFYGYDMQYLEKIVRLVEKGRIKTKYSHHNLIYRRQNHFIFSVDCSGLVEFWLSKRAPLALAEIYDFVYRVRPVGKEQIKRLYSFDFYDYFGSIAEKGGQHWQVVDTMQISCGREISLPLLIRTVAEGLGILLLLIKKSNVIRSG